MLECIDCCALHITRLRIVITLDSLLFVVWLRLIGAFGLRFDLVVTCDFLGFVGLI